MTTSALQLATRRRTKSSLEMLKFLERVTVTNIKVKYSQHTDKYASTHWTKGMEFTWEETSTGMHPAATASKILRLVGLSPLGQKQNLYQTKGKRVYEGRCRVEVVKSPVA